LGRRPPSSKIIHPSGIPPLETWAYLKTEKKSDTLGDGKNPREEKKKPPKKVNRDTERSLPTPE